MGFGKKWTGWISWYISTATFSVLINGTPEGYFNSSRGLRQGDPLSPYLFVIGMEALTRLIHRAVGGGFLSGCRVNGRGGDGALVSHLLFVDDTLVFCEASEDQMVHLSWLLMWFEAISGLRINLDKSEILSVGRVENLENLALGAGCKVGRLPSSYLGIPLGANHKYVAVWDGVEERFWKRVVSLRLEKIQRDFLWGGGALERKSHLVNWDTVCMDKRKGAWELDAYPSLIGPFFASGIGVLRMKGRTFGGMSLVGRRGGRRGVKFWKDIWWGNFALCNSFPSLYAIASSKEAWVEEFWDTSGVEGVWSPRFSRPFNDWEVEEVERLLLTIRGARLIPLMEDRMMWKVTSNGIFSVKSLYNDLSSRRAGLFPHGLIWSPSVPSKVSFFAWEASWGKVLTMDQLKRGGGLLLIDVFCVVRKRSLLIIFLYIAPGQELYGSFCSPFLECFGSSHLRLEIPLLNGGALCWARSIERCGRQPRCASFGRFGWKETGLLSIMRTFRFIG
ncbi:putative mitochondrial protein [Vitis vinifera]|uniref:Putative mitochondrial protein n=1 Tax=Vitis vinifera TaxID=29760 RepID=A0A438FFY6_VITVI|nr:putative mitochondrial protein [Vitis vinifera]